MTRTAAIALLALLTATPSWGQTSGAQSSDRAQAAAAVNQSSSEKVRDNPTNQYILVKTVVGKVIGTIDARALPVEPAGYNLLKYCWTASNVLGDWVERAGFEIELTQDVPRTPAPDEATVALLRTMDPNGVYLRQSKTPAS